jgi:hypothetical protein
MYPGMRRADRYVLTGRVGAGGVSEVWRPVAVLAMVSAAGLLVLLIAASLADQCALDVATPSH